MASEDGGLTPERRAELKAEFERRRGFWAPIWDQILDADPHYFSAYLDFSSVPWEGGALEPKVKELIYIAIDAATTHLHADGTRVHIRNALRHGATKAEIMEVLELISVLGFHSVALGVPILNEELEKAGEGDE
ncbi:MAG: carboxymuconolactone decarboxylase family protein [Solirubrobacterales bacterium]